MMKIKTIDINSDLGEALTPEQVRREAALMPLITSANIACGFHGGGPMQIDRTIRLASKYGVAVGAHPSYPDRKSFGRRSMRLPTEEIELCVLYQLGAFAEIARRRGVEISHAKPHGALYNDGVKSMRIAHAIARAVARFSRDVILVGLAGSCILDAGKREGLKVAAEAFADRTYNPDGTLRSRKLQAALIEDPQKSAEQALNIVLKNKVTASNGLEVSVLAQTICIHGDTLNAPAIARAVRKRLIEERVKIASLESFI